MSLANRQRGLAAYRAVVITATGVLLAALLLLSLPMLARAAQPVSKPTAVPMHGASAQSSWDAVIAHLQADIGAKERS